jgi:squalene-hopene/tetraprenyl-beta-curcumene cyclase
MNDPDLELQWQEQPTSFEVLLANARQSLLEARNAHGYWEGELSSSALSTATAVCALEAHLSDCRSLDARIRETILDRIVRGRLWLIENQNSDGGWGDTVKSLSNISTTLLVWGALNTPEGPEQERAVVDANSRAEAWIKRVAGSLAPEDIARAVRARYGKDQTFSVPILMALASTRRLGESAKQGWKLVPQLPFELAAFPRSWFAAMKLPVVSYALPALIAIGLVRHRQAPSSNPLVRQIRNATTPRCLRVLESIQPQSGGFLEAIPLTSFVAIALIGAGYGGHRAVGQGIAFLLDTFRSDGSWAIDTHLATWVSTLSVNALSHSYGWRSRLGSSELSLKRWICDQQYTRVHPFTNAAPGGWSWTPLSGGVPDADDTPGALLALRAYYNAPDSQGSPDAIEPEEKLLQRALAGANWLLDLQNRDGGIPTFCKGWGTLPFDRSNPDITAHAIRAWLAWFDLADANLQSRMRRSILRAMGFLKRRQRPDGSWVPLWFGNQYVRDEENPTYGTSRVLLAWLAAWDSPWLAQYRKLEIPSRFAMAARWLVRAQQSDGSWTGSDRPSLQDQHQSAPIEALGSIEETALAVEALAELCCRAFGRPGVFPCEPKLLEDCRKAVDFGVAWIARSTRHGTEFAPSPIGFYFAKLWYFEKHYPICYSVGALERVAELERVEAFAQVIQQMRDFE